MNKKHTPCRNLHIKSITPQMHEVILNASRSHGITMTRLVSNLARDIVEHYPPHYRIPGISCHQSPAQLHIYGNLPANTRAELHNIAAAIGIDTSALVKIHIFHHHISPIL